MNGLNCLETTGRQPAKSRRRLEDVIVTCRPGRGNPGGIPVRPFRVCAVDHDLLRPGSPPTSPSIMIRRPRLLRISTLFLALAFATGCDDDTITRPPPSNGGPSTVEILATEDLEFEEPQIQISTGTTVRWRNDSQFTHTVTPVGHEEWTAAEGGVRGAVILEHTFTESGTYEYRCENHTQPIGSGSMYGTIHVIGS